MAKSQRGYVADPEKHPHWMFVGTTGSGKTRFGLRPMIASALAAGWQVVILDRSGLDFLPFKDHPNAHTLIITPTGAIEHLDALFEEIQRRFVTLREDGASTWGRAGNAVGGARVLTVIDEFSNLADALPNAEREEMWRYARMVASEGRKAGVHLAIALQFGENPQKCLTTYIIDV